jgi:hypothetical protein
VARHGLVSLSFFPSLYMYVCGGGGADLGCGISLEGEGRDGNGNGNENVCFTSDRIGSGVG